LRPKAIGRLRDGCSPQQITGRLKREPADVEGDVLEE
jgi:hypothetical protein